MYFDLTRIPLNKIKEDEVYVWYKIEIQAKETLDSEYKPYYGVFRFKKESFLHKISQKFKPEEFIVFIKEETNPVLLKDQKDKILAKCLVKMNEYLQKNSFPEKGIYASG